jgi:hypothetical protein
LTLADIAHLWRERELEPDAVKRPRPVFGHPEINDFYKGYVAKPYIKGNRRVVIEKLLQMLDEHGDCPSVVGRGVHANGIETEAKYGEESYAYLAKIPLWKHSLEVAKCYIKKFQHDSMHPAAMIIALGHDIGKIPAHYNKFYRQWDHPATSGLILMGIPEFQEINDYKELERTVQGHHDMVTNQQLQTLLKEADQETRKMELAGMTTAGIDLSPPSPATESFPEGPGPDMEEESIPAYEKTASAVKAGAPEVAGRQETGKYVPREMNLPDWLSLEAVMLYIAEHINIVIKDDELKGLWHAYSSADGHVWVKEGLLWKAIKEVSGPRTELLSADADEATRRNWLYTVVRKMGERGAVCTDMMKQGYYQVPVTVITGTGKTFSAFCIPFFARAFNVDAQQLERLKGSQIRGLVKNIAPRIQGAK